MHSMVGYNFLHRCKKEQSASHISLQKSAGTSAKRLSRFRIVPQPDFCIALYSDGKNAEYSIADSGTWRNIDNRVGRQVN